MNAELPNSNQNEQSLDERFANRPRLRQRLLSLADMIDQAVAEGCTAHEAEARAIEQIRKLGNELLTDWAEKSQEDAGRKAREENRNLIDYGKKTPDVALDLWRHPHRRTVLAVRPPRPASAPVLPKGGHRPAGLLPAVAKSVGGFRRG